MVHSILIKKAHGFNWTTVEEYISLPINDRVDLVLSQRVKFMDEDGFEISVRDAIQDLREQKRNLAQAQARKIA